MAYSCGSPLVAAALVRLRERHPAEGHAELAKRYRLGNVIFVASDVDLKTFAREHVPPALDPLRHAIPLRRPTGVTLLAGIADVNSSRVSDR